MKLYKGVEIPTTAEELELYSSHHGAGDAAKVIARKLMRAIDELERTFGTKPATDLLGEIWRKYLRSVLSKYRHLGATDTEPYYHVRQTLVMAAKVLIYGEDHANEHYHPEFADAMC